jgi:hypothetical protein
MAYPWSRWTKTSAIVSEHNHRFKVAYDLYQLLESHLNNTGVTLTDVVEAAIAVYFTLMTLTSFVRSIRMRQIVII